MKFAIKQKATAEEKSSAVAKLFRKHFSCEILLRDPENGG